MARVTFDEVDRLIMEKWSQVSELVSAHGVVEEKLRGQLQAVEDTLASWAGEQDLQLKAQIKDGEMWAYQRDWLRLGNEQPWAALVVGGFAIEDVLGGADSQPFACVYCFGKGNRIDKDIFGKKVRSALAPEHVAGWSEDTGRSCPINRYIPAVSARDLLLDADALTSFVKDQLIQLSEFAEAVSEGIREAAKATKAQN